MMEVALIVTLGVIFIFWKVPPTITFVVKHEYDLAKTKPEEITETEVDDTPNTINKDALVSINRALNLMSGGRNPLDD